MDQYISWVATAATITAAVMTASNLGSRITGYGFGVFTVGSIAWFTLGLLTGQPALVWTNAVLTLLNLFGVWRWLGRQATLETGARTAAEASERTPGESLFPVSLLTSAPLHCSDGSRIGSCVDAMAGCGSGRVSYVVVSEGGVAGVGERLRRLDWKDAHFEGDRLLTRLDPGSLERLQELQKDQWPER